MNMIDVMFADAACVASPFHPSVLIEVDILDEWEMMCGDQRQIKAVEKFEPPPDRGSMAGAIADGVLTVIWHDKTSHAS